MIDKIDGGFEFPGFNPFGPNQRPPGLGALLAELMGLVGDIGGPGQADLTVAVAINRESLEASTVLTLNGVQLTVPPGPARDLALALVMAAADAEHTSWQIQWMRDHGFSDAVIREYCVGSSNYRAERRKADEDGDNAEDDE